MSTVFLCISLYLTGGFIVWWRHLGRFEEGDVVALLCAADTHTDNPTLITAVTALILWPFLVYDEVHARIFFNEAAERKRYMLGVRTVQQGVSKKFRNVLLGDMAKIRKRFTKRGLVLGPVPKDQ